MEKMKGYASEWLETLDVLKKKNGNFRELNYFIELAKHRFDFFGASSAAPSSPPRVVLLGHSFPEEIIRGLGETPCYLTGGSFSAATAAEDIVPRDTDSAVKSVLGMLGNGAPHFAENVLLLLPLVSDSMKKLPGLLADLLGDAVRVIPFEVPSDKKDPLRQARFREEILRVTAELEKYLKRHLFGNALRKQCQSSERAAGAWERFYRVFDHGESSLSGSAMMLIADSYHWCEDKEEWSRRLELLTTEMRQYKNREHLEMPHPRVMLLGSPIYAPNYKVPFLIEEMGLELRSVVHPEITHIAAAKSVAGSRNEMLCRLADCYLAGDMSTAFVHNTVIAEKAEEIFKENAVAGVVVHILKGQIEYDFELSRLERRIDAHQLPIFRLETDYNYQDVEQLRIRLEAFAEMLFHRGAMEGLYVKEAI